MRPISIAASGLNLPFATALLGPGGLCRRYLENLMETIFAVVFGAIIAALIPISIEVLRKPKLDLEVVPPVDMQFNGQPADRMRAIRLKLTNKPLPRWARWMYRNPALQCHGNITFHHLGKMFSEDQWFCAGVVHLNRIHY